MELTPLAIDLLSEAFGALLGPPAEGAIAVVRTLDPRWCEELAAAGERFRPAGWRVYRVADREESARRTIRADRAVELREDKRGALLLLVDRDAAGAGMDGVYSAARTLREDELLERARRVALRRIGREVSPAARRRAEEALRAAKMFDPRPTGRRLFAYLVGALDMGRPDGAALVALGLWPAQAPAGEETDGAWRSRLDLARAMSQALEPPPDRPSALDRRLTELGFPPDHPDREALRKLVEAAARNRGDLLDAAARERQLWLGDLVPRDEALRIEEILIEPWRTSSGRIRKPTGLREDDPNDVPTYYVDREADGAKPLTVSFRPRPLFQGRRLDVGYLVLVESESSGQALAERRIAHTGKNKYTVRFTITDFDALEEDAHVMAVVRVRLEGASDVEGRTEPFRLVVGRPEASERAAGGGASVAFMSEAVIQALEDMEAFERLDARLDAEPDKRPLLRKGRASWRPRSPGKSYAVRVPPLIEGIDKEFRASPRPARWVLRVHDQGAWCEPPRCRPLSGDLSALAVETRRLAKEFGRWTSMATRVVLSRRAVDRHVLYLNSWLKAVDGEGRPLVHVNTVEVRSPSERLLGLLLLPHHPVLIAWRLLYDQLLATVGFRRGRPEKAFLDWVRRYRGAGYPPVVPGVAGSAPFVFGRVIHPEVVALVPADVRDREGHLAVLRRALWKGGRPEDVVPAWEEPLGGALEQLDLEPRRHLRVRALGCGEGEEIAGFLKELRESAASEASEARERLTFELLFGAAGRGAGAALASSPAGGGGGKRAAHRWIVERVPRGGLRTHPALTWSTAPAEEAASWPAHLTIARDWIPLEPAAEAVDAAGATGALHAEPAHLGLVPLPPLDGTGGDLIFRLALGDKPAFAGVQGDLKSPWHRLRKVVDRVSGGAPGLVARVEDERVEGLEALARTSLVVAHVGALPLGAWLRAAGREEEYVVVDLPLQAAGWSGWLSLLARREELVRLVALELGDREAAARRARLVARLDPWLAIDILAGGPARRQDDLDAALRLAEAALLAEERGGDPAMPDLARGVLIPWRDLAFAAGVREADDAGRAGRRRYVYVGTRSGERPRLHSFILDGAGDAPPAAPRKDPLETLVDRLAGEPSELVAVERARLALPLFAALHRSFAQLRHRPRGTLKRCVVELEQGRWPFAPTSGVLETAVPPRRRTGPRSSASGEMAAAAGPPGEDRPRGERVAAHPTAPASPLPPPAEESPAGARPAPELAIRLGASLVDPSRPVDWRPSTAGAPHLLIVGKSGMGKTTALVNIVHQLVDQDVRPIVFSFHDDLDRKIEGSLSARPLAVTPDRMVFNPLLPIGSGSRAYIDTIGHVVTIFKLLFPRLGERQEATLREALRSLYQEAGYRKEGDNRACRPPTLVDLPARIDDRGLRDRLGVLDDYGFFEPPQDLRTSLWDRSEPTLVQLHEFGDETAKLAYALFLLFDLLKSMLRAEKPGRLTRAIVFDEAHRVGSLDLLNTFAREGRKFGLVLILASQRPKDFPEDLLANTGRVLALGANRDDARYLAKVVVDESRREPVADWILRLGTGEALFLQGQPPVQPVRLSPTPAAGRAGGVALPWDD